MYKTDHPLYITWEGMKQRCYNPNNTSYNHYGGRGILICDRWLNDFWAFVQDMGDKPKPSYSIDRIDNNGNYEPGNCRWASHSDQIRNQMVRGKVKMRHISKVKNRYRVRYKNSEGEYLHIGYFDSVDEAKNALDLYIETGTRPHVRGGK